MSAPRLYLRYEFESSPWWRAYARLADLLQRPDSAPHDSSAAYAALLGELVAARAPDVAGAIAAGLAAQNPPFDAVDARKRGVAAGALELLRLDLEELSAASRRDLTSELRTLGMMVPAATDLAPDTPEGPRTAALASLRAVLTDSDTDGETRLSDFLDYLEAHGSGVTALHGALRWGAGGLLPIASPFAARLEDLHGLDDQIARLTTNTEALLDLAPAQDALLYGPRGSGKSTAVRALLTRYQGRGLRLVELPHELLDELPALLESIAGAPQRFVIFVDDLSFEAGDKGYGPLKRVLDGGLTQRPANAVVYATSNRRHLVSERHRDRPDPLDDDVHAWDTQNERLALADRFGLVLTFPGAGQKRYLELVRALASQDGIELGESETDAVRFAEWGNGYSGRTARQFVDTLRRSVGSGEPR